MTDARVPDARATLDIREHHGRLDWPPDCFLSDTYSLVREEE